MNLLLISNSTNAGEEYLKYPIAEIAKTLKGVTEVVFIPYAAVTFSYDEYEAKVQARFNEIGIKVKSIHHALNKRNFLRSAEAIVIGGGNTFALLKRMQEEDLLDMIHRRVKGGVPYIGWSAGSNVTCPTICTTNDMPIVQPESFRAIGLVPFQINPHYLDANPAGHAGETREQRIMEYLEANRSRYVVGLREGCMLRIDDNGIELIGSRPMRIFKKGMATYEVQPGEDISFLIKR
ncbi:MAG: dipeptidase PepE [Alistipes sp.]|jgi:dipeptidase E|nr:dipeptidase PepE [Alistipes sp.]MBO7312319.1 dipeptidase PepE [Alistipes sp.]